MIFNIIINNEVFLKILKIIIISEINKQKNLQTTQNLYIEEEIG